MELHTLVNVLPFAKIINDNGKIDIQSIEQDTRKVTNNTLFICIEGDKFDGHNFAHDAVKKGAVAVVANREIPDLRVPTIIVRDTKRAMAMLADVFYGHPSQQLFLIGVTGTNGKTSVSHIVDHIFNEAGKQTGLIGTLYTKIGEQKLETVNTTPDSITLQKTFQQMIQNGIDVVSMEVSSHALIQGRTWGCDYDVAVFTNLTQDHLDYHKTMDEYKKAKSLLFSQLGNQYSESRPKFAVLNGDDPVSDEYSRMTAANVITYGIESPSDVQAKNIRFTANGTSFDLETPVGHTTVETNLIGKFNVYNVLSAIAVGIAANLPIDTIVNSLRSFQSVPGRFELVKAGQSFPVIVDYAHTPDSLENVLQTVKSLSKDANIFCVVGCGGDRDRTKRPLMAQVACKYATNPIFTSDNPRTEDPKQILDDMVQGVIGLQYEVIQDRKEAIYHAIQHANNGDIVVIAGKGHEDYQIIGETKYDFDDRIVAKEAIEAKVANTIKKEEQ
ncbi:UDP-N-acetylmuramoyl-L-alanyl-D-glutamate--2,6-diaminopimelate ligase [Pallidibacillus pasinlerensis]|uniref:UDP-N-acetylmuramoyl-L-alanyl-D-glutamate--2,6-diaminopimelate ligase n=1 Tax=Pallidibacillus pasinlerensis TaxID=2703818 RepID=A0ABX0A0X0_9BACI|nr:UDP-N-acetylmuramoyl-L-alanyl-D-glutamate--2,6-diaminopimelate ligase [Pallidibacillus pasinlerensis]NCU16191.1 UDP-N-acetylmuramoyl-L-alanyl-D-glutamate--2,6-diaminopimelate ligase [Pallidibacillus pasinlerensis]